MPLFEPHIQSISAGTTWATGRGISFADGNHVTFGLVGNTITASVAASAAAFGIAAGTQTATSGTVVLSNSNGVTFGMAGGSVITASVAGGGGSAQSVTVFSQWGGFETHYSVSNGQLSIQKVSLPMGLSGSSGVALVDLAGHTDSSGGFTISIAAYSISGQTAGSLSSAAGSFTWASGSDTTASSLWGGVSGTRYRSFDWPISLGPGDYVFAIAVSTQNDGSARVFGRQGVNIVGSFAGADTAYFLDGISLSTTNAFPAQILATDTNYARTGLQAVQQPGFVLIGTT